VVRLPIGEYTVEVKATGFRTANVQNLVLHIDDDLLVNVAMTVGEVMQEVTVTGAPPLVNTSSTEIGSIVQGRSVEELPLNGRNILQLALLAPGASEAEPGNGVETLSFTSGGFTVSINGGRVDQNEYLLDGIWDEVVYFNQENILPTVDAVSEFRVRGTTADASSGFGDGGVITYVTKSGTNDLHGKAWEFLRNDVLDARNFFDKAIPPYRQNQFGGILSGPVWKNRTFYMVSYEGLRVSKGLTGLETLPTAREIGGDFSNDLPIFDPSTTRPDPSRPGQFIRDPFLGNVIPANRIHPASAFLASFLPKISSGGVGNFVNNSTSHIRRDQWNARLDHMLSKKDQLFARVTIANLFSRLPFSTFNTGTAVPFDLPIVPITQNALSRNGALGWTHTFSPRLLNDFRFGYNSAVTLKDQRGPNFFGMFNILGSNPDPLDFGIPSVQVRGFTNFGGTDFVTPFDLIEKDLHFIDDLSVLKGRHSFKFGFAYLRSRLTHRFDFFSKGTSSFSGGFTADPENPTTTGNSFADYLLGIPALEIAGIGVSASHSDEFRLEWYVADSWKATPKFTFNWGLRYEVMRPPLFKEGVSAFDEKTGNIVVSMPDDGPLPPEVSKFPGATFVTPKQAGFPKTLVDTDKNNFGPRLGFTYDLHGNGQTVIRAGYGLFYTQRQQVNSTAQLRTGIPFYNIFVSINGGVGGILPTPSSTLPTLTWDNLLLNLGGVPGGSTMPRSEPFGQVHQWSLGVQRQISSDMGLEVDYVGSAGQKLIRGSKTNQIDISGGPCLTKQCLPRTRPYPQLGDFITWRPVGTSSYNALIVNLTQRFHGGLAFQAGYTYSHSIDTASLENTSGGSSNWRQDDYAPEKAERGSSNFDTRHRIVLSYLYELPIGPRKRFLHEEGAMGKLLEGWQISGITTRTNGTPLTPNFVVDPTGTGSFGVRPNAVGDPNKGAPHTPEQWFNIKAFAIQTGGVFGNAGRNTIKGPGLQTWDFTLSKNTSISERYHVEFRADFFNAFNHTNFLLPDRGIDSGSFGRIFSARDSRQIQFSLAFSF
jgi:hypothetical protein